MNIVHFHPNFKMANRFVNPLLNIEEKYKFKTNLVVADSDNPKNKCTTIKFKLDFKNFLLLPIRLYQIYSYLKKSNIDLLISHNSTSSLLPLLASKILGIKNRIYFNHGVPYLAYKGLLKFTLYFLEYCNYKLSTEIITVSEEMRHFLNNFGEKKISIINNGSACGINLKDFKKSKFNNFSKKKLNLKINDFTILYVGRPVKRKGFNFTILMWEKYFKNKSYKLLLCGCEDKDVKSILNYLPNNIIPLGFIEEIEEIYNLSDILVLPSDHEGFPYAVLEAMASNCIVIGNDVVGINNIIKNNKNGYLIQKNDFKSYAQKINDLFYKKKITKKIKNQARIDVKKFSRDAFLKKYIIFINNIRNPQT